MANLGIVTPVARGDWNSSLTYNVLNIVKYNNATYMAKSTSTGVPPSSSASAWMKLVDNQTPPATSTKAISEFVILASNENPHNLFGGEWLQIKESFLFGASDINSLSPTFVGGDTGGSAETILDEANMPRHSHNIPYNANGSTQLSSQRWVIGLISGRANGNVNILNTSYATGVSGDTTYPDTMRYDFAGTQPTGNYEPFSNMPPYLVVYIWQRIA